MWCRAVGNDVFSMGCVVKSGGLMMCFSRLCGEGRWVNDVFLYGLCVKSGGVNDVFLWVCCEER